MELAVDLIRWAVRWVEYWGKPVWVVADGAYAKAPFLKPKRGLAVTVVSRLRRDSALWTDRLCGGRGCGAATGWTGPADRLGQAGRAAAGVGDRDVRPVREANGEAVQDVRGDVTAGGAIWTNLVDEPMGWVAFFCIDPGASVADVLGRVADRFARGPRCGLQGSRWVGAAGAVRMGERRGVPPLPTGIHDYRGVDLEPGTAPPPRGMLDRGGRATRTSGRAWRRELLAEEIHAGLRRGITVHEIASTAERLLNLAARNQGHHGKNRSELTSPQLRSRIPSCLLTTRILSLLSGECDERIRQPKLRRQRHDPVARGETVLFSRHEGSTTMPRPAPDKPTDVELQILTVLWDRGPSTVREVHDVLAVARGVGYSTTLKMMQVMLDKGLVTRDDAVRPQRYEATDSRQTTQLQLVDSLTQKVFDGSAKRLVLHLLSSRRISPADLAEIRRLIDQAEDDGRD